MSNFRKQVGISAVFKIKREIVMYIVHIIEQFKTDTEDSGILNLALAHIHT